MVNKPIINQQEINPRRNALAERIAEIMPDAIKGVTGKYIAEYEPRVRGFQIPNNVLLGENSRAEIGRIAPMPGGKSDRELS